jgi:hypothetical protein
MDDFTLHVEDDTFRPMLNEQELIVPLPDQRSQVAGNPNPASLSLLVNETVPLNTNSV